MPLSSRPRCRACGAEIEFVKLKKGTTIPVDPELIPFRADPQESRFFVTVDGEVISGKPANECCSMGKAEQQMAGYVNHFVTCTNPEYFRKQRKSTRKKG